MKWRGMGALIILSLGTGVLVGSWGLKKLPELNLSRNNQIYKLTGVHKPEILGFLPYWLTGVAQNDYQKYLTDQAYFAVIVNGDGSIQKINDKNETEPGWNKLSKNGINTTKGKWALVVQSGEEDSISELAADPKNHGEKMMSQIIPIMHQYGFKDLNLDIESFVEAPDSSRENFTTFVKTVRAEMTKNKLGELSIDIPVTAFTKKTLINPAAITGVVDKVILMTYDFHYRGSMTSGPVAPVGGAGSVRENDVRTAVEAALKSFRNEQLLIGIPFYGYEWETISKNQEAPIIPGSGQTASLARIAEKQTNCSDCQIVFNEISKEKTLMFKDEKSDSIHQIYYDDIENIQAKLDIAKNLHLGGVAFWALGYETQETLKPLSDYKKFYWRD